MAHIAPAGVRGESRQGAGWFYRVIPTPTSYIAPPRPVVTCAIPFFDPLEAEFEKFFSQKLQLLQCSTLQFLKIRKKLTFKLSTAIFVSWSTERFGWNPAIFRDRILEVVDIWFNFLMKPQFEIHFQRLQILLTTYILKKVSKKDN